MMMGPDNIQSYVRPVQPSRKGESHDQTLIRRHETASTPLNRKEKLTWGIAIVALLHVDCCLMFVKSDLVLEKFGIVTPAIWLHGYEVVSFSVD